MQCMLSLVFKLQFYLNYGKYYSSYKINWRLLMRWLNIFQPKSSRGQESRTLFFVGISVVIVWLCMLALLVVFIVPFCMNKPLLLTVTEFVTSEAILAGLITGLTGIWLGHEWPYLKNNATGVSK